MSNTTSGVQYYVHDVWLESGHPVISKLPLVGGSPWIAFASVILYNIFIQKIGPAWMKNRQPFDLKWIIVVHNALLVLVNAYVVYIALPHVPLVFECTKIEYLNQTELEMLLKVFYFYYISKYVDLMDTVFFLLRKKWRNISGLHLFHHSLMVPASYFFLKYASHTTGGFTPFINSFVHVIMYSYYGLTAYDRKLGIWWKKYITQLQLAQFCGCVAHSIYFLFCVECGRPKIYHICELTHGLLFMYMFGSFYVKNYINTKPTKQSVANKELNNNILKTKSS